MPSSVSGQDQSNPALWLAIRADKMELCFPLGTNRRVPQENFPQTSYKKSFIDSVKLTGHWNHFRFASFWTSTPTRGKYKQNKIGQDQDILTLNLVNDPYVSVSSFIYFINVLVTVSICVGTRFHSDC